MPQPHQLFSKIHGKVAVYIDAANLEQSVKALGQTPPHHLRKRQVWKAQDAPWSVDYRKLRALFNQHSSLISINFYTPNFETPSHRGFLTYLKKNGYRIVSKPVKKIANQDALIKRKCRYCGTAKKIDIAFICPSCRKKNAIPVERKANFDVEIASDTVDWQKHYDTIVLFSGDSDFVYLTKILKTKYKKRVFVLSRRGHIANELRNSPYVDFYLDWYELRDQILTSKKGHKMPKTRLRGS